MAEEPDHRQGLSFVDSPRSFPGLDDPSQPLPTGIEAILTLATSEDHVIKSLRQIAVIGNKIRSPKDEDFLKKHLAGFEILGYIPYDDKFIEADLNGMSPYDVDSAALSVVKAVIAGL